jgi:hypothetical protein
VPGGIARGDSNVDGEASAMTRNLVRGMLGLVLAAAATWLANKITEQIFGPEELEEA